MFADRVLDDQYIDLAILAVWSFWVSSNGFRLERNLLYFKSLYPESTVVVNVNVFCLARGRGRGRRKARHRENCWYINVIA
jgi:hypothetical protein